VAEILPSILGVEDMALQDQLDDDLVWLLVRPLTIATGQQ